MLEGLRLWVIIAGTLVAFIAPRTIIVERGSLVGRRWRGQRNDLRIAAALSRCRRHPPQRQANCHGSRQKPLNPTGHRHTSASLFRRSGFTQQDRGQFTSWSALTLLPPATRSRSSIVIPGFVIPGLDWSSVCHLASTGGAVYTPAPHRP